MNKIDMNIQKNLEDVTLRCSHHSKKKKIPRQFFCFAHTKKKDLLGNIGCDT